MLKGADQPMTEAEEDNPNYFHRARKIGKSIIVLPDTRPSKQQQNNISIHSSFRKLSVRVSECQSVRRESMPEEVLTSGGNTIASSLLQQE